MNKYNNLDFQVDIQKNNKILTKNIFDSNVIVIGGAGTIGSNYLKQILLFKPKLIVVVDINENGLTELTRDLRSSNLLNYDPEYITYPVNLLDKTFDKIFKNYDFDIVANFSAHKHVRSEKDSISIEALIKNNVFGAIKLLELCETKKPKFFFSVSTDKAANPVNVMGASKTLMEKLILSKKELFRVSTARFANVAFSNGSLLKGFDFRLLKRQPLSCPSDVKRFFVTPEQSGQICLLATFLEKSGTIFFPKLDFYKDQIFFKRIAINYLRSKGFEVFHAVDEKEAKNFDYDRYPNKYPVYFFETETSGEKKYEEFFTEDENYILDKYDTLGFIEKIKPQISFVNVKQIFENFFDSNNLNKAEVVSIIKKFVPNFEHIETGKHLDQKM